MSAEMGACVVPGATVELAGRRHADEDDFGLGVGRWRLGSRSSPSSSTSPEAGVPPPAPLAGDLEEMAGDGWEAVAAASEF